MTPKQRARIIVPVVIAIGVAVWFGTRSADDDGGLRASGTVEATEADLGFQLPGRIAELRVDRGDRVTQGQVLGRLDQTELEARRLAAQARVTAMAAQLDELHSGFRIEEIAEGRAAVRAAEEQLADARRTHERSQRLLDGGAISQEVLDRHRTAHEVAAAEVDRAKERLAVLETGPRRERIAAQEAGVAQAQANVAEIDAALRNTVIEAPFAGLVTVRHREPGEITGAGAPVVTIMNPDDRWIRIYIQENAVGRVSIGQRATISADTFLDRRYGGEVIYIASEAEFTPRNVQTTEERVKLVYEVRIRVTDDPSFDLKPGLAADVELAGEQE